MFTVVKSLKLFNQLETVDFGHLVLTENQISSCLLIAGLHDCFEEVNCFLSGSVIFDSPIEVKLVDYFFEANKIFFIFFNKDEEFSSLDKCGVS